jgi:hypothetical protein
MHPLDSIIAGRFQDGGQGTTYYFGNSSVNKSFGARLGRGLNRAGVRIGDEFRLRFEGFPSFDVVPPMAPPASRPDLPIRFR